MLFRSAAPGAPTVARKLRTAGYQTIGYPVSYVVQHNVGTGQGFQKWETPWPVRTWASVRSRNAELTTNAALQTLAARSMSLTCTVQEQHVWLASATSTIELAPVCRTPDRNEKGAA